VPPANLTHYRAQVGNQSLLSSVDARLRVTLDREAGLAALELGRNFDLNLELRLDALYDIANSERPPVLRATDSLDLVEDERFGVDWCEDGLCASGRCPGVGRSVTILSSWTERGEERLRVCAKRPRRLCLRIRRRPVRVE